MGRMRLAIIALLAAGCPPSDLPPITPCPNFYPDQDGDGYGDSNRDLEIESCEEHVEGYVQNSDDCDDTTAESSPEAEEICDGLDNNCDGEVDEDVLTVWYADIDDDGFGDAFNTTEACAPPSGYEEDGDDCDDRNTSVNPNSPELCDGLDNDCDGEVDEDSAFDTAIFYRDEDGDGFGDAAQWLEACSLPPGYVEDDTDCDDDNDAISPDADEICDGIDNDCDGTVDDEDPDLIGAPTWHIDYDGDSYGSDSFTTESCEHPAGYVDNSDDCDDTDAAINPGATEICDTSNTDEDCNGVADDDDSSVDTSTQTTYYTDGDSDGYGDEADAGSLYCDPPSGVVTDNTDCDDATHGVNRAPPSSVTAATPTRTAPVQRMTMTAASTPRPTPASTRTLMVTATATPAAPPPSATSPADTSVTTPTVMTQMQPSTPARPRSVTPPILTRTATVSRMTTTAASTPPRSPPTTPTMMGMGTATRTTLAPCTAIRPPVS